MAKPKHNDESGKPSTNRGKAPHKGGYRASVAKGINPFKVYFEISSGLIGVPGTKVKSDWKPGKSK